MENNDLYNFEELWQDKEKRELMKQIVIARLRQLPDNFRISIGTSHTQKPRQEAKPTECEF